MKLSDLCPLALMFATACPGPKPMDDPMDQVDESAEGLWDSTPDDTQFPFDPEGTNCPDD